MGIDTTFYQEEILLVVSQTVRNAKISIMKRYIVDHKKTINNESSPKDWSIEHYNTSPEVDLDEGDELVLKVDSRAHRGACSDFIPNLLLMWRVLDKKGINWFNTTIPWSMEGDSGVLLLGDDKIEITEVREDGGIRYWLFTLSDVDTVDNGTFNNLWNKREIVLKK